MADFLANLWDSVFTPGATPTLLIATNATFVTLQLLLAALLIATYSIHFAILSALSAGLWYSINWFARELALAQEKEVQAERLRKRAGEQQRGNAREEVAGGQEDSADDEGEDTEVEGGMRESVASLASGKSVAGLNDRGEVVVEDVGSSAVASGRREVGAGVRQRKVEDGDRSDVSADSEWEKVDGER